MYSRTITLFNRFGDVWIPTILTGVDLNVDRAAIVGRYGAEAQDKAMLHVRYTKTDNGLLIGEKIWKPPIEWRKQADPSGTLTFTEGNELFDFFYAGEYGDGSEIADDSEGIDGFYAYMNRTYDGVFAISSVSGPFALIPHFEILGR